MTFTPKISEKSQNFLRTFLHYLVTPASMTTYYYPDGLIDLANQLIQRGTVRHKLKGKSMAVLGYLLAHEGQLVSKQELFRTVWPGTVVGEEALGICLRELRHALADDAKSPRYIETVPRRGYRWLAPLTTTPPVQSLASAVQSQNVQIPDPWTPDPACSLRQT